MMINKPVPSCSLSGSGASPVCSLHSQGWPPPRMEMFSLKSRLASSDLQFPVQTTVNSNRTVGQVPPSPGKPRCTLTKTNVRSDFALLLFCLKRLRSYL